MEPPPQRPGAPQFPAPQSYAPQPPLPQPPPIQAPPIQPPLPPPPQFLPPPAGPRRPPPEYLKLRARADRRVAAGALAGGIAFDIATHSGFTTVAVSGLILVVAGALLLSGRVRGLTAKILIGAAPVLGLVLALRSSPWVSIPVFFGILLLLTLGASLGADGAGLSLTFPAMEARLAYIVGHIASAPGMFRITGEDEAGWAARKRLKSVARAVVLGLPVMLIVGALLAGADPIFRSWFDLGPLVRHLLLILVGAWLVAGLVRAASAVEPSPKLPAAPSLGQLEASFVLGGICALYAAFAAAQAVALSGAGHRILVVHGLTYAKYARSGFFELVACAVITLLVLLGVRAFADARKPLLAALSGLTVALTITIVVVAIRRLQLYEGAYGLTMLRLACLVAAVWIGLVFVLLGATLGPRGLPRRLFPAAMIISGLVFTAAWGVSDPAAIVATTNLHRAEHGHSFDDYQAGRLGPDAVPALLGGLNGLDGADRDFIWRLICFSSPGHSSGIAYNLGIADATRAIERTCGRSGP
jgi:two-component system sensor histidine kinase BaeS